ncbi:alpha/beta fold hydrolase [Streptomyces zhihengii]
MAIEALMHAQSALGRQGERTTDPVELPTQRLMVGPQLVEYRLDRRGPSVVVIFHGGHLRAGLRLGEDVYEDADCTVLVPSRPGYGATPLSAARSPEEFADTTAELCGQLGITEVAACVGMSAGGPTAVAMAQRHPSLVRRLLLESAVGPLPWPSRRTAVLARAVFSPRMEAFTWWTTRSLLSWRPTTGLRLLLRDLTTGSTETALADFDAERCAQLIELLGAMRSGEGFVNDLRHLRLPRSSADGVEQPALVVASPHDGSVPFAHAEASMKALARAGLVTSGTASHFVWLGEDRPRMDQRIRAFLARPDN